MITLHHTLKHTCILPHKSTQLGEWKRLKQNGLAGKKGRLSSEQADAIKRDLQVGLLDGLDGLDNMIRKNEYKDL